MIETNAHPCLTCGACCSYYRVSFHPSEAHPDRFHVPVHFTAVVTTDESVMIGTDSLRDTRCIALSGQVGKDAHCSIYENRPSPCRKFEASYAYGVKEPRCDEARIQFGLRPLTLASYDVVRNQEHNRL
jgi:Fe-S-cluster containining protein